MANRAGWFLFDSHTFRATWAETDAKAAIALDVLSGRAPTPATSHFGFGVLTWHGPYLFRTPPGDDLLARGSAIWPREGAFAREGLVETDWSPMTFTRNWKTTDGGRAGGHVRGGRALPPNGAATAERAPGVPGGGTDARQRPGGGAGLPCLDREPVGVPLQPGRERPRGAEAGPAKAPLPRHHLGPSEGAHPPDEAAARGGRRSRRVESARSPVGDFLGTCRDRDESVLTYPGPSTHGGRSLRLGPTRPSIRAASTFRRRPLARLTLRAADA